MAFAIVTPQQALEQTIIRLFHKGCLPTIETAVHQAIRIEQQSTVTQLNYHQVVIPSLLTEVNFMYQSVAYESHLLFQIAGSLNLVGGQLMIVSKSWLRETSVTLILPSDIELMRGLRIIIKQPSRIDFSNFKFVQGALRQNGIAEIAIQMHHGHLVPNESRVIEYVVAPTPRISIYHPREIVCAWRRINTNIRSEPSQRLPGEGIYGSTGTIPGSPHFATEPYGTSFTNRVMGEQSQFSLHQELRRRRYIVNIQ